MYLICTQDKWVRFLHRAPEQKFFDILALNSPGDELAKSPHFECGIWGFEALPGNKNIKNFIENNTDVRSNG